MQLTGVTQMPNLMNDQINLNQVNPNSGGAESQIQELEKEIQRLIQKRACPIAGVECSDETGSRPDIAKKVAEDATQKIRREIDQKIQQLQQKIQQLRGQTAGNVESGNNSNNDNKVSNANLTDLLQQNKNQENQLVEIQPEELKKMGVIGEFIDEQV